LKKFIWKEDRSNIDPAPDADNKYARPISNAIPRHAPIKPMNTVSLKNMDRMNMGFAPIAFIVPISFFLSFTDVES